MINQLIDIVKAAAKLMPADMFEIKQKGSFANIVTSSDIAVQDFLRQQLSILTPNCGFICEEKDVHDISHKDIWIIDPIDGTANYSRGIDQCAISVGLKRGENMELGVVFLPYTNELFYAVRGQGAWLNGKKIHVSDRPFANAIFCTALPVYHKEYASVCSSIITEAFGQCNDLRRFGSAATELCYLAVGRCELYFEYLLSAWDFAAASLILTEAGGILCDLQGQPLDETKPTGVLAANNADNLKRLQEIVSKHIG